MEEEISLFDVLKILYKNKIIIIISVFLGVIASVCYCLLAIEQRYQSTSKIMLTKSKDEYDYNNSLILIKTVSELPKQSIILDQVSEHHNISVEELMQTISVYNPQSSLVIEITCTTKDKNQSRLLANAVVDTLIQECATNEELAMIGNSLFKTSNAQTGIPLKTNRIFIGIAIVCCFVVIGFVLCFIKYIFQTKKEKHISLSQNTIEES